jgi:hypothetical protein
MTYLVGEAFVSHHEQIASLRKEDGRVRMYAPVESSDTKSASKVAPEDSPGGAFS